MSYSKAWQKCVNEIQKFETQPTEQWNHYQLLGYLLSQTSQKFEPVDVISGNADYVLPNDTAPSRHPMLECVRYVFRQFDKCPIKTKKFLDWCLSKYRDRLNTSGLRHLHFYYQKNSEFCSLPNRSEELPDDLKQLFSDLNLKTYGDLSFMKDDESLRSILVERLGTRGLTIESMKLDKIR